MTTPSYYRTDLSDQALKAWQAAHPELAPDRDMPAKEFRVNHDYDPKPLSPAEQFRADMMSLLDQMRGEIEQMHAEITQIRDGLTHASQPPAQAAGQYQDFGATSLVMTYDDKGQPAYKCQGVPFLKFGIRVWPEVLPTLGIDPATLKPGPNPINLQVRAQMISHTADDGTVKLVPQKIIGLA